jgi:ribose transport system permease protein
MTSDTKALPVGQGLQRAIRAQDWREGVGLLVIYLLMVAFLSTRSPYFLTTRNLLNLLLATSVLGMIAVFTTMLMIGGGLDLSVGATTALVGMVIASLQDQLGIWGAVSVGMLVSLIIGVANGLVVTWVGINPLITTLGMLSMARGLAFVISNGLTVPMLDPTFGELGRGNVAGIPVPVVVLALFFILAIAVMRTTTYGRAMYAIGGNYTASYLAGLPVKRYRLVAYTLSGLSAGIAGVFLTSRLGAAAPQASAGLELSVIAAVVLGGTSLAGGKGNLFGTLIGVLILGTLNNGMTLLNVSSYYQQIAQGVVLLLAVGLDQLRLGGMSRLLRRKGQQD